MSVLITQNKFFVTAVILSMHVQKLIFGDEIIMVVFSIGI